MLNRARERRSGGRVSIYAPTPKKHRYIVYSKPIMEKRGADTPTRPPVVAVVGHIDHGKSTLLDYIRRTNVVDTETGGITQHLSAYEATHHNTTGEHTITFLDTPGHEAFQAMRSRGLEAADVAILVVSAEDGVKAQTLEALKLIQETETPYIVALTKIDKPAANIERAKASLMEHGIYLEGMGGNIPVVAISSKTGEGITELLDLILLAAELEGLETDHTAPGSGVVIEALMDRKRGATATLILARGSLQSGEFVVSGEAMAPVRIMENFAGVPIREVSAGSPVRIVGFSALPVVGAAWHAVESKREAEAEIEETRLASLAARTTRASSSSEDDSPAVFPIVIKTDVAGTGDAVTHEIGKLNHENTEVRILAQAVGAISEADIKLAAGGQTPGIVIGFNVGIDTAACELAERLGVVVETFDIIYKLTEWLGEEFEKRRPRTATEQLTGTAKILKIFTTEKGRMVVGGKVESGELRTDSQVSIFRRDLKLGDGHIASLQAKKQNARTVPAGEEFGALIKTQAVLMPGDRVELHTISYE